LVTRSRRVRTPVLLNMFLRWPCTVCTEIIRWLAMSMVENPARRVWSIAARIRSDRTPTSVAVRSGLGGQVRRSRQLAERRPRAAPHARQPMRGDGATVQILNLCLSSAAEQTGSRVQQQSVGDGVRRLGEPLCLSHEGVQIRSNLLWALPVRAVASLWVHDHSGPRDRRRQVVLLLLRQQAIRLPP
jgi:hypothetical protein